MLDRTSISLPNRRATRRLAACLAEKLEASDLVVLTGPLGSGKTFFARALCRALGVPRERRVTSPTFTLVHEHTGRLPIAHADLYRVENERDLVNLGLDALRDAGALLIVEWGEPYIAALGGDALVVTFGLEPRHATLAPGGPRASAVLAAIGQNLRSLDEPQRPG